MIAEYQIDFSYGFRTGSVEGLICLTSSLKAGKMALDIEKFYFDSEENTPRLIMLNPTQGERLSRDIDAVRATKDLWAAILTGDTKENSNESHYVETIRELYYENDGFLAGRILHPDSSFDSREGLEALFKQRVEEKKLQLQWGKVTVEASGLLTVESDLSGYSNREDLLKFLKIR